MSTNTIFTGPAALPLAGFIAVGLEKMERVRVRLIESEELWGTNGGGGGVCSEACKLKSCWVTFLNKWTSYLEHFLSPYLHDITDTENIQTFLSIARGMHAPRDIICSACVYFFFFFSFQ